MKISATITRKNRRKRRKEEYFFRTWSSFILEVDVKFKDYMAASWMFLENTVFLIEGKKYTGIQLYSTRKEASTKMTFKEFKSRIEEGV